MRAIARRTSSSSFTHRIDIRHHQLIADEGTEHGGEDAGPNPQELLAASLASCTAATIEMYAQHKGWDIGPVEVQVDYTPAERGCPTRFKLALRLSQRCSQEQIEHLQVIAAKCPVHRTLEGEVMFEDRLELLEPART